MINLMKIQENVKGIIIILEKGDETLNKSTKVFEKWNIIIYLSF